MRQTVMLVCSFTLVIAAGALAQTFKQEPTTGELQKQLEEMRSQMIQMQNRIAELEAARGVATTSTDIDPVVLDNQTPPPQALQFQPGEAKIPEEPTAFQFK